MNVKVFIDSNIWIYFFIDDGGLKSKAACKFIIENIKNNSVNNIISSDK